MTSMRTVLVSNNQLSVDGSWSTSSVFKGRPVLGTGSDIVQYVTDFVGDPVDLASGEYDPQWAITRVQTGAGSSTFGPTDGVGGIGLITTDDADNDGINAQLRGESFKLSASNSLAFVARMKISDATQSDFFIGLAITDTDILGGVTDSIGFTKSDGSTAVSSLLNKDSTPSSVAGILTADTGYHVYEFHYVGVDSRVFFFIDGSEVARITSNASLPDDEELRLSVHFLTGEALAKTMSIDYIRCIQVGRNS